MQQSCATISCHKFSINNILIRDIKIQLRFKQQMQTQNQPLQKYATISCNHFLHINLALSKNCFLCMKISQVNALFLRYFDKNYAHHLCQHHSSWQFHKYEKHHAFPHALMNKKYFLSLV